MAPSSVKDSESSSGPVSDESGNSKDSVEEKEKMQFSNSCGFIVSLIGYSMGTSDFWRFPYLVFRNGGGAFLIPFVLVMIAVGLPMFFLEVSMSQFSGRGSLLLWDFAPFFKGIGYVLLFINVLNNVYYNILRVWMLEYFYRGFSSVLPWQECSNSWNRPGCITIRSDSSHVTQPITNTTLPPVNVTLNVTLNLTLNGTSAGNMTAAEQFWQYEVLHLSPGLETLGAVLWRFVLFAFIWRLLVTVCMVRSIKSIEKVMYVTVFVPIVLMLAVWVRALMLEGAVQGMLYYITPTFSRITDPKVWLEASMMATYTLGPGWGTLPVIGSHNKFRSNCYRHSIFATVCDILSAVFNGLICFSVLGVMAHNAGLDLTKTVTSGLSLGFTVYPTALTFFPLPQLWSAIFFLNLLLVGLDATILSMETVMNILTDIWPTLFVRQRRLVMLVCLNILAFLLTIPICTQGGMYIFQLLDWYAVAWSLLFITFVECVVFMWVYGGERLSRDMEIMLGRPYPALLRVMGSFISPVIILILLVVSFVRYRAPTYGSYTFPFYTEVLGWVLALLVVLPVLVVFVWKFWRTPGTLRQKLARIVVSSQKWGPNDVMCQEAYPERRVFYRGVACTAYFNLTGRSRQSRDQNMDIYEESKERMLKLRESNNVV